MRTGCPFCNITSATEKINLQTINPKLAKEWHHDKNGELTPKDVLSKSGKKVWWRCNKGHEWQAQIRARTNGNGCPYCAGSKASKDRNLKVLYPELAKEWHPTKNEDLNQKTSCQVPIEGSGGNAGKVMNGRPMSSPGQRVIVMAVRIVIESGDYH